jgi:lysophospholipase L1-like esterase
MNKIILAGLAIFAVAGCGSTAITAARPSTPVALASATALPAMPQADVSTKTDNGASLSLAGEWRSGTNGTLYEFTQDGGGSFSGYVVDGGCASVRGDITDTARGNGSYTGTENTFSSFDPCTVSGTATNAIQLAADGETATWVSSGCSDCGAQTWTRVGDISAKPKLVMAALGDSYSSGEGAGDYYPGTAGNCDRSPNAWALQLSKDVTKFAVTMPAGNLVACSGAVSNDLTMSVDGRKPQDTALSAVSPRPELITVTIGGNDPDLGFSPVLKACAGLGTGCVKAIGNVEARLPAEEKILEDDYKAVLAADQTAIVLVVGYPELFDVDGTFGTSCPFVQQVRSALNTLVSDVDVTINDAVIGTDQANVRFVPDLDGLQYAAHGLCSPESQWWLYPVTVTGAMEKPPNQQMAHPNALGQTAIAKVVAEYINSNL